MSTKSHLVLVVLAQGPSAMSHEICVMSEAATMTGGHTPSPGAVATMMNHFADQCCEPAGRVCIEPPPLHGSSKQSNLRAHTHAHTHTHTHTHARGRDAKVGRGQRPNGAPPSPLVSFIVGMSFSGGTAISGKLPNAASRAADSTPNRGQSSPSASVMRANHATR